MALARELLEDNFKKATIELNASDDRGIETVREKIKSFASQKIPLKEGKYNINTKTYQLIKLKGAIRLLFLTKQIL